jgi:precorrin-6B methylase 1
MDKSDELTVRRRGALRVVGIGVRALSHTSLETVELIKSADKVYAVVADPLAWSWLSTLNRDSECLNALYSLGKPRRITYEEMVERVLDGVRSGMQVCFAAYGHPGVFSFPTHEAIRRARSEGFDASMDPAISAEDCLFADLGVDPASSGYQSFEAADFLVYERVFDPHSALVLWQAAIMGEDSVKDDVGTWNAAALSILAEVLIPRYGKDHQIVVYQAPVFAACRPLVTRIILAELPTQVLPVMSLLYVPPYGPAEPNRDMARRLRSLAHSAPVPP